MSRAARWFRSGTFRVDLDAIVTLAMADRPDGTVAITIAFAIGVIMTIALPLDAAGRLLAAFDLRRDPVVEDASTPMPIEVIEGGGN